jgi:hypothetical protein
MLANQLGKLIADAQIDGLPAGVLETAKTRILDYVVWAWRHTGEAHAGRCWMCSTLLLALDQ